MCTSIKHVLGLRALHLDFKRLSPLSALDAFTKAVMNSTSKSLPLLFKKEMGTCVTY